MFSLLFWKTACANYERKQWLITSNTEGRNQVYFITFCTAFDKRALNALVLQFFSFQTHLLLNCCFKVRIEIQFCQRSLPIPMITRGHFSPKTIGDWDTSILPKSAFTAHLGLSNLDKMRTWHTLVFETKLSTTVFCWSYCAFKALALSWKENILLKKKFGTIYLLLIRRRKVPFLDLAISK